MSKKNTSDTQSRPQKWQTATKAIKATQVAFDMDEKIQYEIRRQALEDGVSPSDEIRKILGLPSTKRPKRPRLTVSLSPEDYSILAEKYGISAVLQLDIKKEVVVQLTKFSEKKKVE